MSMWKKIATSSTVAISFLASTATAHNWGSGMYGGMQGCNTGYQVGPGASNISDEIREMAQELKQLKSSLNSKKNESKKIDRNLERAKRDVERVIDESYTEMIWEHLENNVSCNEYRFDGDDVNSKGSEGGSSISGVREVHGFQLNEWLSVCDNTKSGSVKTGVCDVRTFQKKSGVGSTASCKKGLTDYRKDYAGKSKLAGEIEDLQARIEYLTEDIKYALEDRSDSSRDARLGQTEGGVCIECLAQGSGYQYEQKKTDWGSVIGNVAMGLGSVYLGYKTNRMVSENNATNGWPTDPYATVGYGYGLGAIATGISQSYNGQSGIYGSVGGGMGEGAFGCAGVNAGPYGMMGPYGGANGYGMWGNPYAMQSMGMGYPGTGIYMPGMGPWGMNGPYGMMGPYGNMGNYISGIASGFTGAYPGGMGGYPGGMMMGSYPGAMASFGGMSGNMMGAYPGAMMSGIGGGFMGSYPGGMGGYPGGMMMGSYPGAMSSFGGMSGNMMGAYPGAMMSGIGGGFMGAYPGGMMGGGSYPGGMMGGGMQGSYSNTLGSLQLQQQMMQAQMAQYQQYMNQQQSYMQAEMQKQQVLAGLQSELNSLVYKIQATQMGGFSNGTLGNGNYLGAYPGNSNGIAPIPIGGANGGSNLPVPINNGGGSPGIPSSR